MSFTKFGVSAVALYIYVTALEELYSNTTNKVPSMYGGHLQFLTVLSLWASLVHQAFNVAALIFELRFFNWLQSLLLQVSAPAEILVTLLYWTLKAMDPHSVVDPRFDFVPKPALDRALHVYPALLQGLFALALPGQIWHARIAGPAVTFGGLTTAYWVWVHHTFKHNGVFPYPFLELATPLRACVFVGAASVLIVLYKTLQAVQRMVCKRDKYYQ